MATAKRLTLPIVAELGKGDVRDIKALSAAGHGFHSLPDMSVCVNLVRLDISNNQLRQLHGLEDALQLTWLNVAHNQLTNLDELSRLRQLHGHNQLVRVDGLRQTVGLKALILNDNQLMRLEGLANLKSLHSLVLSRNKLANLEGLPTSPALTQLSVAHNELRDLRSLTFAHNLEQLRLNDNKLVKLPVTLEDNSKLKLLDIGNNLIRSVNDVAVLRQLPALINLNAKGNPLCKSADYASELRSQLPSLRVLDGERFDAAYLKRKQRRLGSPASSSSETEGSAVSHPSVGREGPSSVKYSPLEKSARRSTQRPTDGEPTNAYDNEARRPSPSPHGSKARSGAAKPVHLQQSDTSTPASTGSLAPARLLSKTVSARSIPPGNSAEVPSRPPLEDFTVEVKRPSTASQKEKKDIWAELGEPKEVVGSGRKRSAWS